MSRVASLPNVPERAKDVARLKDAAGGNPAVAGATQTKVAQVVREHVVPSVMQNPVVGDQVHLERVPAGTPDRSPRFEVRRNPGATEPHRMIGDDQFR